MEKPNQKKVLVTTNYYDITNEDEDLINHAIQLLQKVFENVDNTSAIILNEFNNEIINIEKYIDDLDKFAASSYFTTKEEKVIKSLDDLT